MSIPPPTPLTPDDEEPDVTRALDPRPPDVAPSAHHADGITAILCALLLLLILHGAHLPMRAGLLLAIAAFIGVIAYFVMRRAHAGFSSSNLSSLAAMLGLLYGLPNTLVFNQAGWQAKTTLILWGGILLSVLIGAVLSSAVESEERPIYPITLSFLSLFILGNLITMLQ
jgi:predicted neutral ceramidase superfamily lipid hydrolase